MPLQLRLGDPSSFLFVTANSERGEHHGIEATVDWQATERLELSAAVGWLRTKIDEFSLFPELEGREQAHAPGTRTRSARRTARRRVGGRGSM